MIFCRRVLAQSSFLAGMPSSIFSGIINAASMGGNHRGPGGSSVQIHQDRSGLQVHIQGGSEAMMDLLQYLPHPGRNPRLQRSPGHISDSRNIFSNHQNLQALRRRGALHIGGPHMFGRRPAEDERSASTAQPTVHPLLSVTDPRQARDLFAPSTSRGQAMVDTILSAIETHDRYTSAARAIDPQQVRSGIANRRRILNPVVSDRRWGTDIGEIDVVGGRLQSLVESFTHAASDLIEGGSVSSPSSSSIQRMPALSFNPDRSMGLFGSTSSASFIDSLFPESIARDTRNLSDPRNQQTQGDSPVPLAAVSLSELSPIPTATDASSSSTNHLTSTSSSEAPPLETEGVAMEEADESNDVTEESNQVSGDVEEAKSEEMVWPSLLDRPEEVETGITLQCPPGIDEEVWSSLPYDMQVELSESMGGQSSASVGGLLDETELDRDVLDSLPPAMRSELLREEAVERRRRASFDESGNLLPQTTVGSGDTISSSSAAAGATAEPENYMVSFLSSLPHDLRVDALLSADEASIASLPPDIQAEARQLQQAHSMHMGPGGMFRLAGWDEDHGIAAAAGGEDDDDDDTLHAREENRRLARSALSNDSSRGGPSSSSQATVSVSLDSACLQFEDNVTALRGVPFSRLLPSRLLLHLFTTRRARLSRPLLRLMVSVSKFAVVRKPVLRAIMSLIFSDRDALANSLRALQPRDISAQSVESTSSSSAHSTEALSTDALTLLSSNDVSVTPVTLRRLLNALYYLCKKTDKLCWYDLMSRSCGSEGEGCDSTCLVHEKWMFAQLLELLVHPGFGSNANIDMVLHVIQDIIEPLTKLNIPTVNALVARGLVLPTQNMSTAKPVSEIRTAKRVRIADPAVAETVPEDGIAAGDNMEEDPATSSQPKSGIMASRAVFKSTTSGWIRKVKCDIPFPVLDDRCAAMLAGVVQYEECGGAFPSRLGRILTTLSLYDGNWTKLLECLRTVAENVALNAIDEARHIRHILGEIIQKNGNAAVAMALPHLSTPSTVSELRLLHILRLITNLRTPNGEEMETSLASVVPEVSDIIRRIDFQDLWDLLVGILDLVRQLEGIREQGINEDDDEFINSPDSTKNIPAFSSLTMRFVPLIECFLTVCGACVLRGGDTVADGDDEDKEGGKRKRKEKAYKDKDKGRYGDESKSSDANQHDGTAGQKGEGQNDEDNASSSSEKMALVIKKMQMPGTRFRQTPEFKRMQQDLDDSVESNRLLHFVESNSVLLNMVLKQNVNLLESSFGPLIQIPRCRALLHFDIKRAFFKMKLKRMKRNSRYNEMSSRLKVGKYVFIVNSLCSLFLCRLLFVEKLCLKIRSIA